MKTLSFLIRSFVFTAFIVILLPSQSFAQTEISEIRQQLNVEHRSKMDNLFRNAVNKVDRNHHGKSLEEIAALDPALRLHRDGSIHVHFMGQTAEGFTPEALQAEHKYLNVTGGINRIFAATIPIEYIPELLESPALKRVELAQPVYALHNESMGEINVPQVHQGVDLPFPVTGEGVLVGVVDTGIDFIHPDFFHDDGSTRILYILDHLTDEMFVWTKEDIDNNPEDITQLDVSGHGTHVAGTAAGGGKANPDLKGVAPDADLIIGKVNLGELDAEKASPSGLIGLSTEYVAIFDFMKNVADDRNQRLVINMSYGSPIGPRDGSTLMEMYYTELSDAGLFLVPAMGNARTSHGHAGGEITDDGTYQVQFNSIDNLNVSLGWYTNNSVSEARFHIHHYDHGHIFTSSWIETGSEDDEIDLIDDQGNWILTLTHDLETVEDPGNGDGVIFFGVEYNLELVDAEEVHAFLFTLELKASGNPGRFDIWGTPDILFLPGGGVDIADHHFLSGPYSTLGVPASAKRLISVGAYTTKIHWTDYMGEDHTMYQDPGYFHFYSDDISEIGQIASFSSKGPTRDGRILPIISAPGEMIFSAHSSQVNEQNYRPDRVLEGQMYSAFEGTSMAAPHVTGVIALMLQVNPDLDYDTLINILEATAVVDEFTGPVPNNRFGFGKIDAHAAVKMASDLFVSTPGDDQLPVSYKLEQNYPNPFNPTTQINFELPAHTHVNLEVFDVLGRKVATLMNGPMQAGSHSVQFDASSLSSGMYIYRLRSETGAVLTRKMMLVK